MAVTTIAHGDLTADGTEQTIYEAGAAGTFQALIDSTNLAAGDIVKIRQYVKTIAANSYIIEFLRSYRNAQSEPGIRFPACPAPEAYKITLEQIAGTNRVFPWAIILLGA